jgi:hypothetical protein
VIMARNSKTLDLKPFATTWVLYQFSSLYTPPQNGVVERKNKTLCEMAQTMLNELGWFWAEAVNTVCYVSNRI